MELSKTNFDIDLDQYDSEIPWLNRIPSALYLSCTPSPNAFSKNVQNSRTNKAFVDLCERSNVMPDVNYPDIRRKWMTGQVEQSSFNDPRHPLNEICDKPFVCEICQKAFRMKCHLSKHKKAHYKITIAKPKSKPQTKFHRSNNIIPIKDILPPPTILESQHGYCRRPFCETGKQRYICTICGKHFSQLRRIKDHLKIHTGIGLHCCQFCSRSFTRKDSWEVRSSFELCI